jgi:zinc protease
MISGLAQCRLPALAVLCILLSGLGVSPLHGQSFSEPQREQLLNGLRVLIWQRPSESDVLIKLRIHSGAAFDLAGKSGEMGLLGDLLFPDPATREYFTDQMQGKLSVVTDYDAITITMLGKVSEFERIIEILRNGLVATQLSPEIINSVREGRIKIVKETSISQAAVADRAIAARLFGDFPYGQPHTGSAESLARIERADLMLARDRFLNPNNSTLAIVGGVQSNRALRALRQLLGSWRKSEKVIPATFRQPKSPDARTLLMNAAGDDSAEIRLATRGLSRGNKDSMAATVLASIMRDRWQRLMPELARNPMFVRHEPRTLPGMFVMGASVKTGMAPRALSTAREVIKDVLTSGAISTAELEQAKEEAMIALNKSLTSADGVSEVWLDLDTYKLPQPSEQVTALQRLSVLDVQRTATSVLGKAALATVVVGNGEQLRAELERITPIEVLGDVKVEPKPAAVAPQPNAPALNKPD